VYEIKDGWITITHEKDDESFAWIGPDRLTKRVSFRVEEIRRVQIDVDYGRIGTDEPNSLIVRVVLGPEPELGRPTNVIVARFVDSKSGAYALHDELLALAKASLAETAS
jgi:hypothetical protein